MQTSASGRAKSGLHAFPACTWYKCWGRIYSPSARGGLLGGGVGKSERPATSVGHPGCGSCVLGGVPGFGVGVPRSPLGSARACLPEARRCTSLHCSGVRRRFLVVRRSQRHCLLHQGHQEGPGGPGGGVVWCGMVWHGVVPDELPY